MLSPIEDILQDLANGRMVVLVDDEDRENEGDLVLPAERITPEAITFMLSVARGYLCLALAADDCERLELHPQASVNTSVHGTAFTVSIDGSPRHGFTTGVSAPERARTIKMAIDPSSGPGDFVRPGHVNPLRARDGGALVRAGQTEGSVDLCRLAGLHPSAVIIEIMRDDGEMARLPDLEQLCIDHNLKMCSVAQVIEHRLARETLVKRMAPIAGSEIDTEHGRFNLIAFESVVDPLPHIALTVGGVGALDASGAARRTDEPTLVRMHRRNVLGDVFGDRSSGGDGPTRDALVASMRAIQEHGRGAIVYLRPEGTGGDMEARLQAIKRGGAQNGDAPDLTLPDAAPMALREYGIGGQILRQLGLSKLRLMTNHPKSLPGIEAYGLEVVEHVALDGGRPA